jgi:hypothetical protein
MGGAGTMTTTKTSTTTDGDHIQYEIQELIESEVGLAHRTGPEGLPR